VNPELAAQHADNCRLMTSEFREYRGSGVWVYWAFRLDKRRALRWIWP
jgi:hypothetical protein